MTLVLWNRHLAGPRSASDFRLQRYDNNRYVSPKPPTLIKSKILFTFHFFTSHFFRVPAAVAVVTANGGTGRATPGRT